MTLQEAMTAPSGTRPTPFMLAMEKILDAADQFSELVPKHEQTRHVLLSGECAELVKFMERQSQRIKELQAAVDAGNTAIRFEADRADRYEAQLVEICTFFGKDARNCGTVAEMVRREVTRNNGTEAA